jgi:hypothetical protein
MKKLLIGLLFITSLTSYGWEIVYEDDIFILKQKDIQIEVESSGGMPKFLREVKLSSDVSYFVYYSGTAGTSKPVSIDRAVIYNLKTRKTLGDFPYRYRSSSKLEQPKWLYNGDEKTLKVVDSESSINKLIHIK